LSITNTQPGQYVPTRDLMLEVAQGLKKKGIATLAYVAADGPTAAPAEIINNFPVRSDTASDPDFRKRFNQMIKEWAERWGTDVAGWWIDGAWIDGYSNPIDGQTNLDELISAARAGNPAALIAANPSSGKFTTLTDRQNFLAGEDTYFSRLPSPTATSPSNQPAWHTISFLGTNWGEPSATRYDDQQLINYIQAVNQGGGIVTMDVAVDSNGHLSSMQVAQVAAVKTAVRGGAV
jgi:Alpha-L-fucosidase